MKKMFKTMTAAVLALALTLSLAACGVNPTKQAEAAVSGMLDAAKVLDFEAIGKYTGAEEIFGSADELDQIPGGKDLLQSLLGKMKYKILSSEQTDEETVYVATKITAVDMKPVFTQFMSKAMEYILAHIFDAPSDEEIEAEVMKILTELLDAPDLATVDTEVAIKVVLTEDGWKVDGAETLVEAMLGGLEEAAAEFGSLFG